MLTAVPDIILGFVAYKTGTKREDRLALAAKMQKINAIKTVLTSNPINIHISNKEKNVT